MGEGESKGRTRNQDGGALTQEHGRRLIVGCSIWRNTVLDDPILGVSLSHTCHLTKAALIQPFGGSLILPDVAQRPRIQASPMPPKTTKTKTSPKKKSSRQTRGTIALPRRKTMSSAKEELFAKAFRSSPHPIGITELESGRCLEVNDACLELFGFRRDEVVGHTTLTWGIRPDPLERVTLIDRFHSERSVQDFEVSLRVKNGDLRQFLITTDLILLKGKRCLLRIGNDITERKRAEEALRRSEERWQLAATGTTDGIWDWDVAGHTVLLSAQWKQLRGYREEEIGVDETEWSSRIHPEDSSRVMATVQSYFNKEIPTFHCEYRTRRKDGTYFWINDRGIAVWDAQGRVVRMVGSETDITERKRAEMELRHSEERFRTVVESAPNGILLVDGGGRIVLVNGQIERQFGYRREELIGHPVERLLPERFRRVHAGLRETYQKAPETRAMGRGRDLYGLRKDGSELPIEIGLSPIETISGTMVLASVMDITERKQREHALVEQRRLYKTVTDNAVLALFIMDDSQQCVFMNPAAEALTGFVLAEVMGRPLHDVVHHTRPDGSHYPLSECPIDQAFPKNDREQGEEIFVHKDGHFYSVAFTASPIRNELGQPVGTVIEVQDITERKQAEEELYRFNETLEQRVADRTAKLTQLNERLRAEITERKQVEEILHQKQGELQNSQAQLQDLTAKLFTAQDSERQRIARDLHDDFSQRLAALTLDVVALERHPPLLPELISKALEPVREELTQLSDDLRRLAHRLHPPLLQHAGLQAAIEDYIHKAIERTGLQITFTVKNVPGSIPLDWSTCLFRVLQEGLQNVAKHAKATEVVVKLSGSSKGIGLSVIDNGKGFEARDKSSHQKGLGLTSMQERLRLLNGFFNIHSRLADGTKVCAWIPYQDKTS